MAGFGLRRGCPILSRGDAALPAPRLGPQLALDPHAGPAALDAAIREGAVQRVRPKAMTVAVILAGLFPDPPRSRRRPPRLQRIAAPMIGGMLTARCCRWWCCLPPSACWSCAV
jgi:hypothetical protein